MSTCPEKDIHSIYLDNELPQAYVAKYEEHVASCPECRAYLESLKAMHTSLSDDSKAFVFDQAKLDQSYARLQARLSYSKVTGKNIHAFNPFKSAKFRNTIISGATGAAVAAVLVALILPGYASSKKSNFEARTFTPVARTQITPPSLTEVKVDGQINPAVLSSLLSDSKETEEQAAKVPVQQNVVRAATVSTNSAGIITPQINTSGIYTIPSFEIKQEQNSREEKLRSSLTSYDIFCPMLNEEYSGKETSSDKQGITIHFNPSLGYISFEVGSKN